MLTIDQLKDLKDDLRAQFQAVTGLTWDPASLKDEDVEKIQWYFPKGAGFDKEHIAFDKELINSLGSGELKNPYYNVEEGDDQNTPPEQELVKGGIDTSDEATLSTYNIKPEDAAAADENGNGVVKIVSKPVQDEEGKYLTDSEENYTKVYEVEDDSKE